jgi:superfamily II DNA or RNA helicase/diadenosine tetraphosphate (Ap4A) HIT family hydrolase/HKD family nuclease
MSVFFSIDPSAWVAHNELAFAVRDAFPVSPGHTLVVTRRLVATWWDATLEEQHAVLDLVDRVRRRLDAEYGPAGYNVGFNAGAAAGQTVAHLHVHVIPRFVGDMADPRGGVRHVIPGRGNYLAATPSEPADEAALVTPLDGHLKLELIRCLIREDLDRIDLVVSFVKRSGIDLIARRVDEALERGATIRLLTTDYLSITDAEALGFFLDRLGDRPAGRLEVRVFSDPATSFHPKAYIFSSSATGDGVAFVGSSNLTRSGITQGIEWNVRSFGTRQLVEEFDRLWADPRSIPLTAEWLARYDADRRALLLDRTAAPSDDDAAAFAAGEEDEPIRPWSVQAEALTALEATRLDGHAAGLVVMATGLGKTWLAAFDSTRPEFRRVLFVAHRDEILAQSRDVYRRIRPSGRLTLFTGGEREPDGDVVFASVQSLHRNLAAFDPEGFDYVVVDEFHHAAATTYRKVLAHFRPRFLLGLTATPERADNADLLALCADNLVYDCGLVDGVNRGLLSPFRYRAIPDVADYEHIPWRNGRFDIEELTAQVATEARARQVHDEWSAAGGTSRRTIGFCCSIAHADFMAAYFRDRGVRAVAVHSGPSTSPRAESLEQFAAGTLPVLFTVDLFNEGVDVPAIDLVMMLRPTESSVVFLQQLGRGLRRTEGKSRLDVVDLVGNHRGFLLKARLLTKLAGYADLTDRESVDMLAGRAEELADGAGLPDGCSIVVDSEVVDLLRAMLGPVRAQDRMIELIRQWVDEHERRPTALEIAVLSASALQFRSQGGWFGQLEQLGLLSDIERQVLAELKPFLLWVEHGNYTKSYKLVTLLALLQLDGLRSPVRVGDVAAAARWILFRDVELLVDLSNAGSAFADPSHPSVEEWERYWRRNPIEAMTTPSRGEDPWFSLDGDLLRLITPIGGDRDDTVEEMVRELVEYRLHRYKVGQSARRVGQSRRPSVDGVEIDATFTVESTGPIATSVVIEAAGGKSGTKGARNLAYSDGFACVLERLASVGARIIDACVDTDTTSRLSFADRRLSSGAGRSYPIDLASEVDLVTLQSALSQSMAKVGRSPDAKGSGDRRKRIRLIVDLPDPWTSAALADMLAAGAPTGPVPLRATSQ